jgi:nitroreductase/FMN reductase [NAD(P)H]
MSNVQNIQHALQQRFGEEVAVDPGLNGLDELTRIAGHRVHRRYDGRPVDAALLRLLCACALSAPSKSDLQQRDIVIVEDRAVRRTLTDLIPDMPWIAQAPVFLVFCANGRRLPQIAALRGKPFPNDHLDLLFNAATDAALALATFLRAAHAVGLGCCPISVIRNEMATVARELALPDGVFPVAGLCVGYPPGEGYISMRLPPAVTVHTDVYDDANLEQQIDAYDRRRAARHMTPREQQRNPQKFGYADFYGWSEDKARQAAEPEGASFAAYVRAHGFSFDGS